MSNGSSPLADEGRQERADGEIAVRRRYPDAPLVGVAAAIFDAQGRVLLVRRGRPPQINRWGLPGGLLHLGEQLAAGARREVWEECGLEIEIGDVAGVFEPIQHDDNGDVEYHYVVIDFWAKHLRGQARAQDDAVAVAWVDLSDLGPYHLTSDTLRVVQDAHRAWSAATRPPAPESP